MWHAQLRWLICVLSSGTPFQYCAPFTHCQVAIVLMWPMMWPNQIWPCVSIWWSGCWHGPLVDCHVAWVGPTCQICGTHMGEVDQWGADTWHWHAEVVQWGADTWHSLSLLWFCMCMFEIPNLHPAVHLSPSCTQISPWLNLSPWFTYLICFIFSEFILIAPVIKKSWIFHQKSLNSWWLPL
jgi:hypothetical protein